MPFIKMIISKVVTIVKIITALIAIVIVSILGMPLCLARPLNPLNTYWIGRAYGHVVLRIFRVELFVKGLENYEKVPGPGIVNSNHQDNLDAFIIGRMVPPRTVSMGKKIIRLFPFFGQIYWLTGNILIQREKRHKALHAMNQARDAMIQKNIKVWIMPEGTRSKGKGLAPFKKGAFFLSKNNDLKIIPVAISNYYEDFYAKLGSLKKTIILMEIYPPLDPKDFDDHNSLKEKSYSVISQGLSELGRINTRDKDSLNARGFRKV